MKKGRLLHIQISLILIVVLATVVISWYRVVRANNEMVLESKQDFLAGDTKYYVDAIMELLQSRLRFVENLSEALELEQQNTDSLNEKLETIEKNTYIDEIYYLSEYGYRTLMDGTRINMKESDIFQNGIQGKSGISESMQNTDGDKTAHTFSYYAPLQIDNETFGVLVGSNYYEDFAQLHRVRNSVGNIHSFLVRVDGTILLGDADNCHIGNLLDDLEKEFEPQDFELLSTRIKQHAEGDIIFRDQNGRGIISFCRLGIGDLVVVQIYDSRGIGKKAAQTSSMLYRFTLVISFCMAFAVGTFLYLLWLDMDKKAKLMDQALDTLGEAYPRIVKMDYGNGNCVLIKDREKELGEEFKTCQWEIIRDNFLRHIHPEDVEMARNFTSVDHIRRIAQKNPKGDTLVYRRAEKGEYQWLQSFIVPIIDKKSSHSVMIFSKLVDESVLANELHKKQLWYDLQKAKKAEKEKSVLLQYMAMSLEKPLSSVDGFIKLAIDELERGTKEKASEYLKYAKVTGQYVSTMLGDVVSVSKNQKLTAKSNKTVLSIERFLYKCRISYEQIVAAFENNGEMVPNVSFETKMDKCLQEVYLCDEVRLMQIVVPLLSNAYKFNKAGGSILLELKLVLAGPLYDRVQIKVTDTGCGMEQTYIPGIFDLFSTERTDSADMGLGLCFAKKTVDMLQGKIEVESRKNEGSCFTVTLDLEHTMGSVADRKKQNVLVANDNKRSVEIIVETLKMDGFKADGVIGGVEALQRFRESPPGTYDVLLTGLRMSDIDGFTLAKALRVCNHPDAKRIAIVAISTKISREDEKGIEEAGIDGYLETPFQMEAFERIINRER